MALPLQFGSFRLPDHGSRDAGSTSIRLGYFEYSSTISASLIVDGELGAVAAAP